MRPTRDNRRATVIAVALLAGAGLWPQPAAAAPTSRITAVHDVARCASRPCTSSDPKLADGARVTGTIQISVESTSQLGLEWVRLQLHLEGRPANEWICLQQWFTPPGTFDFSGSYEWNTVRWPDSDQNESECEEGPLHFHGSNAVRNGTYTMRAIGRERSREIEVDSPRFKVTVVNPPTPPSWAGEPSVSDPSGAPSVRLRWNPSREERSHPPLDPVSDIAEYHIIRIGPDASERETAVNAADPAAQGCKQVSALYLCTDSAFPAFDRDGTYRYALIAYRFGHGSGVPCATVAGTCLESALGEVRSVRLSGGPAAPVGGPAPAASPTGTSIPSPDASVLGEREGSEPVEVTPRQDRAEQVAAAEAGDDDALPVAAPIAGLLVAGLAAVHVRRLLGKGAG